jgi:hypothetical protein
MALLQQPGGFEGIGALVELELAHAKAVAERVDVISEGIELDPAASTPSGVMDRHDDVVSGLDELLGVHLDLFPRARPPLPHRRDLIPALRRYLLADVVDHIARKIGQRFGGIVALVAVEEPADDLDVLPRHRLSRGRGGSGLRVDPT